MLRTASITQVKNESGIIEHQLDVLSLLVQKIIIIDDNSEDTTVGIIKSHKNRKNIILLKGNNFKRDEGGLFLEAFNCAKRIGTDRVYIADADEIVPPQFISAMYNLITKSEEAIRLMRAEMCYGQKSYYGLNGTGKLVLVNTNDAKFDINSKIHCSQPSTIRNQILVDPEKCCLLHYGTADYAYQIFKCFSYIVWENKDVEAGINEYFFNYENFVEKTNNDIRKYLWEGENGISSPMPYAHFLNSEIREILSNVDISNVESIKDAFNKCKSNCWFRKNVMKR